MDDGDISARPTTGSPPWPWASGPTRIQKVALVVILALALGPAAALFIVLRSDPTPVRDLVSTEELPGASRITVTALGLDPQAGELRTRMLVEPGDDLLGDDGRLLSQIAVVTNDARGSTERLFEPGTRPDPFEVTLPVSEGSVVRYPVDRYGGSVVVVLLARETDDDEVEEVPVPISLVARSLITDFELSGTINSPVADSDSDTTDQAVSLTVVDWSASRPLTTTVYATWLMVLMWGLAVTGALLVWAVVIWMVEVPFWGFGYFVGVLFALPPLRDSLPGRPPPGTIFDFVSFYWSITIIGVTLMVLLAIWLRRLRTEHAMAAPPPDAQNPRPPAEPEPNPEPEPDPDPSTIADGPDQAEPPRPDQ